MRAIKSYIESMGQLMLFLKDVFLCALYKKPSIEMVFDQIWKVFHQSIWISSFSGFFVGAIMTIQFSLQMKMFGALGFLGALSTSSTLREVGPLLIAFMLSGKVGAFTSAELGTMKITEQIDAIRCLGANPIQEIIVPRFVGIIIASFFLLVYGVLFGFAGGALMSSLFVGVSFDEYIRNIPNIVTNLSVASGVLKALCFSFIIASLSTFYGFTASGGAKSVGLSVVKTAVQTMLFIVVADWITSAFSESIMKAFNL